MTAPINKPGIPATKNAHRQPKRAATWVLSTGATASPTNAAALTTIPMLRPRRDGNDDSSISAVMIDHVGPSAMPINARTISCCWKLWTAPDTHDRTENAKTAGIRIRFLPKRSDTAPKNKEETAHVMAST